MSEWLQALASEVLASGPAAGGKQFQNRNFRAVTSVILQDFLVRRILASPTTEPGRRGWEWRL